MAENYKMYKYYLINKVNYRNNYTLVRWNVAKTKVIIKVPKYVRLDSFIRVWAVAEEVTAYMDRYTTTWNKTIIDG